MARALPTTNTLGTNIQIVGQEIPDPGHVGMVLQSVTPGFFQVLGIPVRRGREFTPRDNTSTSPRVVIVNESFARRFWQSYPNGVEPLGKRIVVPILGLDPFDVVGVVADVRHGGLRRDAPPQFYLPNAQYPPQSIYLAVRTNGDPLLSVAAIRSAVLKVDPDQSIASVRMMDEILERSVGRQHLATRLLGFFAGAALLLALVGLYGVLAYSVAQRTQEIGIRRSLGAGRQAVLGMVLRQALRLTVIGVLCGLAGAFALTRVLETLLFQVSATDPGTFHRRGHVVCRGRTRGRLRAGVAGRTHRSRHRTATVMTSRRWALAGTLTLTLAAIGCAGRTPPLVPAAPSPVTLDEVSSLILQGCYHCLEKAYEVAQAGGAGPQAFEAAALLVLRSKELGLPAEEWLERARALATADPHRLCISRSSIPSRRID